MAACSFTWLFIIITGALIFDEVKVIGRLLWNSRSQKIIGLSMTRADLATLTDIYQSLREETNQQTSHIMQFLWRDLTSTYSYAFILDEIIFCI